MRQTRDWTLPIAIIAYVLVGMGTVLLGRTATSPRAVTAWRLSAWILSLAIFGIHFAIERRRHSPIRGAAARVALAVALASLALAALGPVRSHWGDPSRLKVALLSVVAWPLATGLPAFVVALVGGHLLRFGARPATEAR